MSIKTKKISLFIVLFIIAGAVSLPFFFKNPPKPIAQIKKLIITPTPYQFPYKNPEIRKNRSYRILIVGDSIVGSLGINANSLRLKLINYYPDSEFVTYNYGYGSTNILSLPKRLNEETTFNDAKNPPILRQGFELIIIESFGYNPLSEFPLEVGLKMQNDVLDSSVKQILAEKPGVAMAFMTPIAMDSDSFARNAYDLSTDQRKAWVEERKSYINNHKRFAEEKGIPVIDVYGASLNLDGKVDKSYIGTDFIHPSQKGIDLISKIIADYIYTNEIFPFSN